MGSILDKEVTFFNHYSGSGIKNINLLQWLKDPSFEDKQTRIRLIADKSERDALKKQLLPAITPSGIFTARGDASLVSHTGLIQIDVDKKGNQHIKNYAELKSELSKIENVAYCGLSASGEGYWGIVPIAFPKKHREHFEFLRLYFESKGLKIDTACKDVSRLRFYSYDPLAYFNHHAKQLKAFYELQVTNPKEYKTTQFEGNGQPIWALYNRSNDFEQVLYKHGWTLDHMKGNKARYTRPRKAKGVSADFDFDKRVFYVFTDGSSFIPNKGYNPFAIYAILEHGGDFSTATKYIASQKI